MRGTRLLIPISGAVDCIFVYTYRYIHALFVVDGRFSLSTTVHQISISTLCGTFHHCGTKLKRGMCARLIGVLKKGHKRNRVFSSFDQQQRHAMNDDII